MPLFSKSKGHEICQQKNLVAINEFFNSDVDIYHLERIALRCVILHNIYVSFFFSIGHYQEENENTTESTTSRKEGNT